MVWLRSLVLGLMVALLAPVAAWANDSAAEIALGGLVLKPSDAITLDREDLYISKLQVRVKYVFTNTSDKDVETLVAFPLPDQRIEEDSDNFIRNLAGDLKFKTLVDGKPADLTVVEQAFLKDVDVTARIKKLGLSIYAQDEDFSGLVGALPNAERAAALQEGLLLDQGSAENPYYAAGWTLRTAVTRNQIFPAGKSITVEHSYVPLAGGSVGGNLNANHRKEQWSKEHFASFCVEDSWLLAFDRELAKRVKPDVSAPYAETWIGYVLKSGANWKGPIKDFRMVIDKGEADALVSFCAEGVKKIAPTQFEVRKKNFEPTQDLKVMIVEWMK